MKQACSPCFAATPLHQALVAHALVDGLQGVAAVLQRDLELPGGVFGDRGAHRQALHLAGIVEIVEEGLQLLELQHAVDLRRLGAGTVGESRRLRTPVGVARAVEQVELQLHRHHRVQALGGERADRTLQHAARICDRGRHALLRMHRELHLRGRLPAPRLQHEAPGQWKGPAVGVAHVPHQAGFGHVLAVDREAEDARRQRAAVTVGRDQFLAVQQLAARHAVGVDQEGLDEAHLGVRGEEGFGFGDRGEGHLRAPGRRVWRAVR